MRKLLILTAIVSVLLLGLAGNAFGGKNPSGTGQPSQSCETLGISTTPGGSSGASGSAFNPEGVSGSVYADGPGTTPNLAITNEKAVSQYDVACFQQS